MEKKKISVIGIGGRTGTMFAFELRNSANVLGVGKEQEIEIIRENKLFLQKEDKAPELFDVKVIKDTDFGEINPDIIFLTTKNPVSPVVKYYFEKFKGKKIPALFISQNGIEAIEESKEVLKEIFGEDSKKIKIIKCVLFNPIDKEQENDKTYIKYSLPIRIAVSKVQGQGDIKELIEIFKNAGFKTTEFFQKDSKNLEFSKLFLNLIGMASASCGFSIKAGFKNKKIFIEETQVLKEYIQVVKKSHGKFLNFPHYPVKFLSVLFNVLPISFLMFFRNILANIISKERKGKPKDLDEIDYYNGGVVKLGDKIGAETPINKKVYKRVLGKLGRI
jgi:ketopantoate reductase